MLAVAVTTLGSMALAGASVGIACLVFAGLAVIWSAAFPPRQHDVERPEDRHRR